MLNELYNSKFICVFIFVFLFFFWSILGEASNLIALDLFNILNEKSFNLLKENIPSLLYLNRFMFSGIARPKATSAGSGARSQRLTEITLLDHGIKPFWLLFGEAYTKGAIFLARNVYYLNETSLQCFSAPEVLRCCLFLLDFVFIFLFV